MKTIEPMKVIPTVIGLLEVEKRAVLAKDWILAEMAAQKRDALLNEALGIPTNPQPKAI